ncbi:MAG: drug:proton antiporter, partial [Candidatus Saccharicenans sp.]
MTLSFYLNHLLSLFSEEHQIMAALIVRGFGMGLLFTPISTMALAQIPPRKMAQASGMFNVIRQIGGSFGVAMFGTLMTERVIFHTTNFGAAVDSYSPVFKNISLKLQHFAQQALGGGLSEATSRAKYLLLSHISNQAVVTAITDDFLIAAGITISCLLFLLLLKSPKRKGKKMAVSID